MPPYPTNFAANDGYFPYQFSWCEEGVDVFVKIKKSPLQINIEEVNNWVSEAVTHLKTAIKKNLNNDYHPNIEMTAIYSSQIYSRYWLSATLEP